MSVEYPQGQSCPFFLFPDSRLSGCTAADRIRHKCLHQAPPKGSHDHNLIRGRCSQKGKSGTAAGH